MIFLPKICDIIAAAKTKQINIKLMRNPRSTKAFTLVEVLVVLAILGLMGVIALTMYVNSTGTFKFFSNYNAVYSTLRVGRSMAINNSDYAGGSPDRYGIYFNIIPGEIIVKLFADDGVTPYVYDEAGAGKDSVVQSKSFSFSLVDYDLVFRDSADAAVLVPVTVFYEKGSGDVSIFEWNYTLGKFDLIPKTESKYISIELNQKAEKLLNKYIILNQISGLPEEYEELP